ncbi:MAG: 5-formyltetrahydrofolate cyclo-ligase [Chloroflexaceae bacterium]|nr:5-formyltetrahydrofolate cyclo-ligase [Chloroflexaceae bacterium]
MIQDKSKAKLRRGFLQQRRALSLSSWQEKSDRLRERLQSRPVFQEAHTVLAYFSFRQEPDLSPLFGDRRWGFPRCVGNALSWHGWEMGDALEIGAYGIPEPLATAPQLTPEAVDLILVPAVACDRQNYRLGYGGGFYDRLLSSPPWSGKVAVGIVFDFAYVSELPRDSWDRPLSGVCSD